jgi:Ser/Thr protein kinase RdoA (MazF antagonist)
LLDRTRSAGAVAHLNRLFHGQDEYLSIADGAFATCPAELKQAIYCTVDKVVVHGDFKFYLPQQIGGVFVSAVGFGLAPLPRKAHGVTNGEACHADPFKRLLHQFKLGGLDDSDDELHGNSTTGRNAVAYSIPGPAIWAKCIAMNRLDQPLHENVQAILANWLSLPELLVLKTEGMAGGMSGARFWKVSDGKKTYCLRKTPKLPFLTNQANDLREIHTFLEYLWANGCHELARPIRSLKEQSLVETRNAIWELSNFLPGEVTINPSNEQALAAIQYLAKLHVIAPNYQQFEPGFASALKDRRKLCQELVEGKLDRIVAAIRGSYHSPEPQRDDAQKIASQIRSALTQVTKHLEKGCVRLPLQWCLVDCHIGNFLFTDNQVTGLVDFGTAHRGSVARDIARLVGSVTADNLDRWRTSLDEYQKLRPLSAEELHAVLAFHTSGLVGRAARWLEWRFISRSSFADAETTHQKLEQLSAQLAAIDDTAAVFATIPALG